MSLQSLLYWIHWRRDILVSPDEVWWSSLGPDRRIQRACRRHRKALKVLIAWSSIEVCPAAGLHRKYWRYAGGHRYVCSKCEELSTEIVRCG